MGASAVTRMDTLEASAPAAGLAETLARIDARLSRLEAQLQPVAELSAKLPMAVATFTDIVDDKAARLSDVEARLLALSDAVEHLTRPQTLATLRGLVDIAENAPDLVATFTDMVDEAMAKAGREGLELHMVADNGRRLLFGVLRLVSSPELAALLDSGMLDPRALRSLGELAENIARVREQPPARVGAFGALRALSNPDVQRALGFVLEMAAGFGRSLAQDSTPPKQLTSG